MKESFTQIPSKLAMINSFAGYGRCSTTISLPVLSVMGIQVCPVPTAVLSNHLGFSTRHFTDYTAEISGYLQAWKDLNFQFDGLYCGYLGNVAQIDLVQKFIEDFKPPFVLLDPVLGDHGKLFSATTEAHCEKMKQLLSYADYITPNLTEACILADYPYKSDEDFHSEDFTEICNRLSRLTDAAIIITGISRGDNLLNLIYENNLLQYYEQSRSGGNWHGSGDLFASALTGRLMQGMPLLSAVINAANFTSLCISGSEAAQASEADGILFEKYLSKLIP